MSTRCVLFAWVVGQSSFASMSQHSMDLGMNLKDAIGRVMLRSRRQAGSGHNLLAFSCMCVCACVLVCVFVCALRACPVVRFVSPAGPELFLAQSRSGRIAELWNRIKHHYKTFVAQSRLQSTDVADDPHRCRRLRSCVRKVRSLAAVVPLLLSNRR